MSSVYFKTVTDEKKYAKKSKVAKALSQLPVTSGSRWGAEHLKACHVVVNSKVGDCLPVLNSYHHTIRETFKPGKENAQIAAFIKDLAPEYRNMRQHALVREPEVGATLARFWTALRDVKTLKSDEEEQQPIQRTSSRLRSQGSFTSEQRPAAHLPVEVYTVELAFAAINHILLYTQNPSSEMPVEIRQQERCFIQIGNKRITAIDDGGLTLIDDDGEKTEKSVVLLEAKRRLDVCDEANRPFVSDELLGQMTCEAIAARSSRQGDNERNDIFIVNTTQQYMCFFHFILTADHLRDIEYGRIPGQAIKVTATHWFNLERPPDRECIVKNVLQLAEYMRPVLEK
ncbi:hypothetical protein H9Q74_010028 [Fusarium xylarioides]|nr:hypothetical protein H9Q74_010028 [Fusarium xylarioides]